MYVPIRTYLFMLTPLCAIFLLAPLKKTCATIKFEDTSLSQHPISSRILQQPFRKRTKLYILWMFSFDGSPHGWGRVPLGRLAIQDINQHPNNLLSDFELVALERPTTQTRADFDVKKALGIFIEAVYSSPQLIMTTCPPFTPEAVAIAQLAPNYNLITMASLASSPAMSDKKAFPLFFRTSMSAGDFKYAALAVLKKFGWRQYLCLMMDNSFAMDTAAEINRYLESHDIWIEVKTVFKLDSKGAPLAKMVKKSSTRVLLAIADGDEARYAICQLSQELGATGTEFVWLFIGISVPEFERPRPYDTQNCTFDDMKRAINGSFWLDYGGLDLAEDRPMLTKYRPSQLQQRLIVYLDANYPNTTDKTILELTYRQYDAFLAIAAALNSSIDILRTKLNATLDQFNYSRTDMTAIFKQQLLSMNIQGAAGPIKFSSNGDRPGSVTLRQFQATPSNSSEGDAMGWVAVAIQRASHSGSSHSLQFIRPVVFGTVDQRQPLGIKDAGMSAKTLNIVLLVVGVFIVCVVLPAIAGFAYYSRRQALAAALNDRKWILNGNDFALIKQQTKSVMSLFASSTMNVLPSHSNNNMRRMSTNTINFMDDAANNGVYSPTPNYDDDSDGFYVVRYQDTAVVCLFPLVKHDSNDASGLYKATLIGKDWSLTGSAANLRANRQFALESTQLMNGCVHDNLARFYGMLFYQPKTAGNQSSFVLDDTAQTDFAVYEWQNKGSLRDVVLDAETLELDLPFRFCMWNDVALGLAFIHRSAALSHCHGRLRSSNIFVDNRFCCKISDFGYSSTKKSSFLLHAPKAFLLWTAPELLKPILAHDDQTALLSLCSSSFMQKADLYSLAVVTYEILTRRCPYQNCTGTDYGALVDNDDFLNEIVESSIKGENLLQEYLEMEDGLSHLELPREARKLFGRCCNLSPQARPTAQEVVEALRLVAKHQGLSNNILENLIRRVEQYAKNLEALVHEKTQAFFDEKKRAETLLYNILPRSVADQLKQGKSVEPEFYDSVSIYFSDVVGFTNLSAESTPVQVVDLLNDLYNMFDAIIADYDVYKVETIGDAYMVASGLPQRNGIEHARQISRMAQQLVCDMAQQFRVRHKPEHRLNLRVGLHSGPCAAGVVGFVMPRYCLFGDTVNTASRMESTGEAMRIHVSTTTYELLQKLDGGEFVCELRGETAVKGKGLMRTYWLQLPVMTVAEREQRTMLTDLHEDMIQ